MALLSGHGFPAATLPLLAGGCWLARRPLQPACIVAFRRSAFHSRSQDRLQPLYQRIAFGVANSSFQLLSVFAPWRLPSLL